MRRAHRVSVDAGSLLGPPAGGAGMVEVNMGYEHIRHVRGGEAEFGQARLQHRQRAHRPRFDEAVTGRPLDQIGRDGMI
jgi:hypothetical protein